MMPETVPRVPMSNPEVGCSPRANTAPAVAKSGAVEETVADMVEEELGVRCRFDRLGNMQRCFALAQSQVDLDIAYAVGDDAVRRACSGETDVMITIQRKSSDPFVFECETTSLSSVAGETRCLPAEYINDEQNGVTTAYLEYARPLIAAREDYPPGLPNYPRFQRFSIEPKLEAYER